MNTIKRILLTKAGRFKLIAALEGLSFLCLVCVAVPLKHIWGQPWLVEHMGMYHGIFFLLYILAVIQNKVEFGWATGRTLAAIALSFVPFGTFYVVKYMLPQIPETALTVESATQGRPKPADCHETRA